MPGYIILAKMTEKGLAEAKNLPDRMKQARGAAEKLGGRVVGMWVTMGQYDGVTVLDMPNDQAVSLFTLGMVRQGTVTTQTMRALSEEEFAQVAAKLP